MVLYIHIFIGIYIYISCIYEHIYTYTYIKSILRYSGTAAHVDTDLLPLDTDTNMGTNDHPIGVHLERDDYSETVSGGSDSDYDYNDTRIVDSEYSVRIYTYNIYLYIFIYIYIYYIDMY
jgi:hypothetical protein